MYYCNTLSFELESDQPLFEKMKKSKGNSPAKKPKDSKKDYSKERNKKRQMQD